MIKHQFQRLRDFFLGSNIQRNWIALKKWFRERFYESIDDIAKKVIIGIIMFFFGIISTFLYQQWYPDNLPLTVHGYVRDHAGNAVVKAKVLHVGSKGKTLSDQTGYYSFKVEINKKDTSQDIEFNCVKNNYTTYFNCGAYPEGITSQKVPTLRIDFKLIPKDSLDLNNVKQKIKGI